MSIVGTLIVGGVLSYIFWKLIETVSFQYRTSKKLTWIKNPLALPLFGNLYQLSGTPAQLFSFLERSAKELGHIYKVWIGVLPTVIIQAPDVMQDVLKSTINIDKSHEYEFLKPYIGDGLLVSTGAKWHSRRKLLTNCFHLGILEKMTGTVVDVSKILVSQLNDHAEKEDIFNLMSYIKLCTLDVMMETSIGKKINAQLNPLNEYVAAIYEMLHILMKRSTTLLQYEILFRLSPYYKRHKAATNTIRSFSAQVIKERRLEKASRKSETVKTEGKRRMALLDLLLETEGLADSDIQEEVDTFVFEGHDTTTSGVSFTLFLLGHYPEAQKQIVEELDRVCPDFTENGITYSQLGELEFLDRCIKEALRIYPPVIFIGRHTKQSISTDKGSIPDDTSLMLHIHNLHHNQDIFPNPNKFDPDRFLPENSEGRHPFAYVPFSAGPRNCIGKKFATMEMKILISAVLKNYTIESIDKQEDLVQIANVINNTTNGIRVKLSKRV